MKNKNIKNKPKNVVDAFSYILNFPKYSGGEYYKGNTSIKPSKSFCNNNSSQRQKKKKKKPESPPPLKQSTRSLLLGYTEIEKRRRALGKILLWDL